MLVPFFVSFVRRRLSQTYQVGDGLVQGKVNRELLEKVFGERLMASLASFNRERAVHNLLHDDSDAGDEKDGLDEGDAKGGAEESFVGTNEKPGKLQVSPTPELLYAVTRLRCLRPSPLL